MTDEVHESPEGSENYVKIGVVAVIAVVILTGITIAAYQYAKGRSSTTVLPGGTTYLGPGEEQSAPQPMPETKFSVTPTTPWTEYSGKIFNYTFSHPSTLPIVVFPNDLTDSVAVSWNNVPPQNNIMIRVIDIRQTEPEMVEYIGNPMEYVNNWWRQWSGLKGVKEVTKFVNAKGVTGYRAIFINNADQTPNEDVFFEVPGRTDLMVRFANGPLEKDVFDRVIDSFTITAGRPQQQPPAQATTPATQPPAETPEVPAQ